MDIPYDVRQLIGLFFPGSRDEFSTREEWIADVVGSFNAARRENIRKYLDELLNGRHSDAEIAEIWRSCGPGHDYSDGGHRIFLTEIRDMISAPRFR